MQLIKNNVLEKNQKLSISSIDQMISSTTIFFSIHITFSRVFTCEFTEKGNSNDYKEDTYTRQHRYMFQLMHQLYVL